MIFNYLKIAIRNILKRKIFSFINIFGLAIAVAVSLLLFSTALRELSFNNHFTDVESLHTLYFHENTVDGIQQTSNLPLPLVPAINEQIPAISQAVRIMNGGANIEYNGKLMSFSMDYVDAEFLDFFDIKLFQGDQETALQSKDAIVLSEQTATAIFGEEDPIGKTIKIKNSGGSRDCIVSAVTENHPYQSSIRIVMLAPIEQSNRYNTDNWGNYNHHGYAKLAKGATLAQAEEQLQKFVGQQFSEEIERIKRDGGIPDQRGDLLAVRLLPMKEMRFNTSIDGINSINKMFPLSLLIIGFFILAIACINFVNLTLGNSLSRATEVGVRKVFGARRFQLIGQFWGETLVVILIAALIGMMVLQWALPYYNAIFPAPISISSPFVISSLIAALFLVGIVAGTYPAWVLSRFQAAQVLKKEAKIQRSGWLRNTLVVVQFVISILLICCTLIVDKQIQFLRNKPLGFNKEQVVSIPIGREIEGRRAVELFRNKTQSLPEILSVSGTNTNLGMGLDGSKHTSILGFDQKGKIVESHWISIDYDFVKTLDLELVAGREFDRNRLADTTLTVIINEAMAAKLDEEEIVGSFLETDPPSEIIGVVKNFNFQSLNEPIRPMSLAMDQNFGIGYIYVKITPQNIPQTMNKLKAIWKEIAPRSDFRASLLDENNARLYRQEETLSSIFTFAAFLTIFISCLGLFAIAVMNIVQRTKEIGIRKVLGASTINIVNLLSKEVLLLVILAGIISIPLAWFAMNLWLQDFHYRIEIPWWIFLLGILIALIIAFLTVSIQSFKAANSNPIKALKYE